MQKLTGKRVLLIAPNFFGYDLDILNQLKVEGAHVDHLIDRPFENSFLRALTTFSPSFVQHAVDRIYLDSIADFNASCYDLILVVNGQTLSLRLIKFLRVQFKSAKLILYLWDSIANRPHTERKLSYFDEVFSFDPTDSRNYSFRHRALFYGTGFEKSILQERTDHTYDISFIGTAHSDRFSVIEKIRAKLDPDIKAYWYLYLQARWVFRYYKFTKSSMRNACESDFKFAPLKKSQVASLFFDSFSVLDIEHPKQVGLTMRTFEAFGAYKKLITTNKNIKNYDFFSPENICILDRENPFIPEDFFVAPYVVPSDSIRKKYSISGWLDEILY